MPLYFLSVPLVFHRCCLLVSHSWPFSGVLGHISCKIAYVVRDVCKYASIFTLAVLSIDRCLASYHSLGALRTIRVGKIAIYVIWITCAVIAAPYFTFAGIRGPSESRNTTSCQLAWPSQLATLWTALQFLLGFVIPSAIVLAAYAILFRRIRLIRHRSLGRVTGMVARPNRRMLHTVLVIVMAFIVCQTPYTAFDAWPTVDPWPKWSRPASLSTPRPTWPQSDPRLR